MLAIANDDMLAEKAADIKRFDTFCFILASYENNNKTGTPQVGAISKAQKAQNIFLEKTSFGKCRVVPKNVKGGPFLIYKHAFCSKITKNSKGTLFDL